MNTTDERHRQDREREITHEAYKAADRNLSVAVVLGFIVLVLLLILTSTHHG